MTKLNKMRFLSILFLSIAFAGSALAQSLTDKTPVSDIVSGNNFNAARAVAVDVDTLTGKTVYVFNELDASGTTRNVWCAIYDEYHNRLVNNFIVNYNTANEQISPTVKVNQEDNTFIVAWQSKHNGTDYDIYIKRISLDITDATSASVSASSYPEVMVHSASSYNQTGPRLAFDYGRNEVVVGFTEESASRPTIARQFNYTSNSLTAIASQFTLTTGFNTLYGLEISSVNAELLAVYTVPSSPFHIYKRSFTYSGGSYSGQTAVQVNTNTSNMKGNPSVCMNQHTGAYAIGWESAQDGSGNGAYTKIYSSSHSVLKSETQVNSSTSNNQQSVKSVWDEKTGYLIYFFYYNQSGFSTIRYRIMDNQYNFTGNEKSALVTGIAENNTSYTSAGGNYSLAFDQQSRKLTLAYDLYNNFTAYSKACIRVLEYTHPNFQPSSSCSTDLTRLWMEETTYDEYGNIVAQSRSYSDMLGRTTQVQSRNIAENKILAAEVLYDRQGRAVLQTLPAPITQTCFTYNINFIAAPSYCGPDASYPNCSPYTYLDFDKTWNSEAAGEINNPNPVGKSTSALGTYYSTLNTAEPYVPESSYPYSRIDYNDRIVGGQVRSSSPGSGTAGAMRMGQGHEAKSIVLPLLTELDANYLPIRNTLTGGTATTLAYQGTKSISTDQNGKETVTFRDNDGRVLASAISNGTSLTSTTTQLGPKISWYNFELPGVISITNLNITCSADIEILSGTSNGLTSTSYSGSAASYNSTYSANTYGGSGTQPPFNVIQVRSTQPFTISYSIIYSGYTHPQTPVSSVNMDSKDLDIYTENGNSGITVNSSSSSFKIYDLVSGSLIGTYASTVTGVTLTDGPYRLRIEGSLPTASLDYSTLTNALSISHNYNYSEWSYVFYDDAGRPIREVAPKGVDLGSSSVPNKFYSQYTYNTLGWTLSTLDSDKGLTEYVYQKDGQLRFSQDARQRAQSKFSYIHYNTYGDITEQGEYSTVSSGDHGFQNTLDIYTSTNPALGVPIGAIIESTGGLNNAGTRCASVNTIEMHKPDNAGLAAAISGYTQRYVNGRISKSYNSNSTSWYSYNEQGQMEWMVQAIPGLGAVPGAGVKTIHYEYGLLGNLKRTIYQKGTSAERFDHKYDYDANLRLSNVKTKTGSGPLQQEALYKYYQHGPLKRTELATNLQGIDYVYTIDGQLKSINHPTLDNTKDPGKDSYTGANSAFAADVFGMQLQYFEGDYTRTGSNIVNTALNNTNFPDQFIGAIKGMKWQVKGHGMGTGNSDMLMYAFAYDNKYQLLNADFGTVTATNEGTYNTSSAFDITNTYDINGNLLSKLRKDNAGSTNHDFTYAYGSTPENNKLNTLTGTGTVSKTFEYDQSGKTTRETSGGNTVRSMTYNPYDLLTEVKEYCAACSTDVTREKSDYNERGQRIKKEVYTTAGVLSVTTWYVRDAAGSIISVYDNSSGTMIQTELPIYGNGKIGQVHKTASTTSYTYELTDHLGTVRATINRNKVYDSNLQKWVAAIETWTDYYADGEVMPTRSGTTSLTTRYGYQGAFAEENEATGFIDFDLRNYDITTGRWIQPDPYAQHWSPYNGMGNDPVSMIDPDGGWSFSGSLGYGGGGGGTGRVKCPNYKPGVKPFKGKTSDKPDKPLASSGSENNTGNQNGNTGENGNQNEPMDGSEDGDDGEDGDSDEEDVTSSFNSEIEDMLNLPQGGPKGGGKGKKPGRLGKGGLKGYFTDMADIFGPIFRKAGEELRMIYRRYFKKAQTPKFREENYKKAVDRYKGLKASKKGIGVRPEGIPSNWIEKPSKRGDGKRYIDPSNPSGNNVRVMQGDPNSPYPNSRTPYVKWTRNGASVDKNGNPVSYDSPDAHIPLKDFIFH
jgi:RHS repeat-associated protein